MRCLAHGPSARRRRVPPSQLQGILCWTVQRVTVVSEGAHSGLQSKLRGRYRGERADGQRGPLRCALPRPPPPGLPGNDERSGAGTRPTRKVLTATARGQEARTRVEVVVARVVALASRPNHARASCAASPGGRSSTTQRHGSSKPSRKTRTSPATCSAGVRRDQSEAAQRLSAAGHQAQPRGSSDCQAGALRWGWGSARTRRLAHAPAKRRAYSSPSSDSPTPPTPARNTTRLGWLR